MASETAQVSLDGVTNVGAGIAVDFLTAKRVVSAVIIPSGSVTAGQVLVEASQDNTNWVPQAYVEVMPGVNRGYDNTFGAYRYWRASVASRINGGSVRVTFMEAG